MLQQPNIAIDQTKLIRKLEIKQVLNILLTLLLIEKLNWLAYAIYLVVASEN